jgi:uncharacterized membrane protein affecting hemolysin expression
MAGIWPRSSLAGYGAVALAAAAVLVVCLLMLSLTVLGARVASAGRRRSAHETRIEFLRRVLERDA